MPKKIALFLLRELFPHLKLKDKNLSFAKKIFIYLSILVQIWVVTVIFVYLSLPYIAKSAYSVNNVMFYDHTHPDGANENRYFSHIAEILSTIPLYDKDIKITLHLLNNHFIYSILNPIELLPHRQTFAITFDKSVFIAKADILNNKVLASNNAKENLDAILVHEAMHAYQHARYGFFYTAFVMPYWIKEGYPLYISDRFSYYPMSKVEDFLRSKGSLGVNALQRFSKDKFYALMVKHAIEDMGYSVDDLHTGKVAYEKVKRSLLQKYDLANDQNSTSDAVSMKSP